MPPCLRCGGLLISNQDPVQKRGLKMLRCVQCGDVIDPVVLEHRMFAAYPARPSGVKVLWWLLDGCST